MTRVSALAFSFQPLRGPDGATEGLRRHKIETVTIKSRVRSTPGNIPAAKLAGVYKDLYFLSLVKAQSKILVLTDPEFHDMFKKDCNGILPPQTVLQHIQLSEALQSEVSKLKGRTD